MSNRIYIVVSEVWDEASRRVISTPHKICKSRVTANKYKKALTAAGKSVTFWYFHPSYENRIKKYIILGSPITEKIYDNVVYGENYEGAPVNE
jgi:hypothetical protein